jgi:hypothetical protein
MEKERLGKALTEKISVPMGVSSDTRTCFSPTTLSSSEKLHVTPETGAIGLNYVWIFFYVLYSTLLHLPPLRFHSVGG